MYGGSCRRYSHWHQNWVCYRNASLDDNYRFIIMDYNNLSVTQIGQYLVIYFEICSSRLHNDGMK